MATLREQRADLLSQVGTRKSRGRFDLSVLIIDLGFGVPHRTFTFFFRDRYFFRSKFFIDVKVVVLMQSLMGETPKTA
ncbi:hypothetical protein BJP34_34960 [Moorena producens PAL-8-15-08-1]|uniref:Uncharacterized protein n=1 Tax=Moorena producens PAL-8-15-08-1 TaxID=1458985 RepID=A0A1D8U231_9CYAN|nr:hypothetical protein BJP34_34960 [Moorena producens PAL-8-15-08-1]